MQVMESTFFKNFRARIESLIDRIINANPLFGLVYILVILPIFFLFLIGAAIGATPGFLIHYFLWSRYDIKSKDEGVKIIHDLSLISFSATSFVLFVIYVAPYLPDFSEFPCSTHPYC